MPSVCSGITMGAAYDCNNPLKASVAERLLIGNLDDIDSIVYNAANTTVVENIIMKAGTSMYAFTGVRSSNKPNISLVADDVSVGFSHQMDFSVFEVDSAQKVNLQGMSARKQFVIYQNPKDSSLGDAVWEVLGLTVGLEMSTLSRDAASKDGSYKIQLKTSDSSSETGLPNSFWDTDISTTETAINTLFSSGVFNLISATVETAAPNDIILTFDDNVENFGQVIVTSSVSNFVNNFAIVGPVMTITMDSAYLAGDTADVSGNFESLSGILQLVNEQVTINVV